MQLRADGDDVGNGEAGQGGAEDGDVGGQRRGEAAAGSEADLEGGAEAVGRRDRGLEAVGQRERDVGIQRALRAASRARDAEVDAVDGGAVDLAGEVVAHVNGHVLADGSSAGARGRSAADSDAGVLGEALPRGLGGSQRGRVGRGVVGDGLDGEGLSAAVAGASIALGHVDDGVGGRLVDPGPGRLGSLQGGGAVELDGDVLGAAVDGFHDVLEVEGAEETDALVGRNGQVGVDACLQRERVSSLLRTFSYNKQHKTESRTLVFMSPDKVVLGSKLQVRSTVAGRRQDQVGRRCGLPLQEHRARRHIAEQSDQKAGRGRALHKHDDDAG